VMALVHTLGVKASMCQGRAMLNGKDCGPWYKVSFYMAGCARLPRKAVRTKDGTRTPGRFLTIEPVEPRDTTCITVDHPSHLFLAGEACIVTHNSETFSRLLPAYYLHRHPERHVGLACYGAALAWELSDDARAYYQE